MDGLVEILDGQLVLLQVKVSITTVVVSIGINLSIAYRLLGQERAADADKAKACSLDKRFC